MIARILIADDHEMIRSGLRVLLKSHGFDVVAEAAHGDVAVAQAAIMSPDVVVMDVRMPVLDGIEATRLIRRANPSVQVIGLTGVAHSQEMTDMLAAGAMGFVSKASGFAELAEAIRTVIAGRVYVSPIMSTRIPENAPESACAGTDVSEILTPREQETLQVIANGRATKQIASALRISVKTAETHRRNLMMKLDLDSVAGLTKYAIRQGLAQL